MKYWLIIGCLLLTGCDTARKMLGTTRDVPTRTQIFIMYGESGMAGRDVSQTDSGDSRIKMLGFDGNWKQASEPTHESFGCKYAPYMDQHSGYSPGLAFARELLVKHPDLKIGLVPCARNGRTIQELSAGGVYYQSCMQRIHEAEQHGDIAGILLFQGVNDAVAHTSVELWINDYQRLINDMRNSIGYVPVVQVQLMNHADFEPYQIAQALLAVPGVSMVRTKDLPLLNEYHLNADGTGELGRRMGRAWLTLADL